MPNWACTNYIATGDMDELQEFATLCREIHRHMEAELSKGGRSEIDRNKLYN